MKKYFQNSPNDIVVCALLFLDPGRQPLLLGTFVNSSSSLPSTFSVVFSSISSKAVLVIDKLDLLTLPECLLISVFTD